MVTSRVFKYPCPAPGDTVVHHLPHGAQVVAVGVQEGRRFCFWAALDPNAPPEPRRFGVVATGQEFDGVHVGTIIDDPFVWHLVELPTEQAVPQ